jgi:hypothetical protein
LSTGVEAIILMTVLRRRIGGLDSDFGAWLAKLLIATAVMTLMAELVTHHLNEALASPTIGKPMTLLLVGYAVALVGATYFVAAWLLRIPEVTVMIGRAMGIARRLPVLGPVLR